MKKRSAMMTPDLVVTLTVCGRGNVETIAAPSSGSEAQAEAKTEEKTEADIAGQEEKEESRTETSGDTVTLKLSNNQPDGNCTTIVVGWFAGQVGERMGGRVNIGVYSSNTLGGAIFCLGQLQYDGTDIVKTDLSTMTNFVDECDALTMPYIYKNIEHFWRVHGGDIGMGILCEDKMREKRLYRLTHYDGETRCFYNTRKETHSPEDMEDMLVRVQQSKLVMSMVETLGGQLVATVYSEVYSALQVGIVDAVENSIVNYLDQSYFEVAPYFAEDHHTRPADILVMGKKSRRKLSAEDLRIIDDTAPESWEYQKELQAEVEEESKQKLLEQDAIITELTEDESKALQGVCEPIWHSYEGGVYKNIIDQIVEAGK